MQRTAKKGYVAPYGLAAGEAGDGLIDNGLQSKEIADNLFISVNTVHRHRQNILQKLKVGNAIEACKVAKAMGLIS